MMRDPQSVPQSDPDLRRDFERARAAWLRWPLRPRLQVRTFTQQSLPIEREESPDVR